MLKNLFRQRQRDSDSNNSTSDPPSDNREIVYNYHEATKHHLTHFARSLGYLDWANQPEPFRRFSGAPLLSLPLIDHTQTPLFEQIYRIDQIPAQPFNWHNLGQFFQLSLALSAWKEFRGSRWSLRINPSSGNLHPTEGYIIFNAKQFITEPATTNQLSIDNSTAGNSSGNQLIVNIPTAKRTEDYHKDTNSNTITQAIDQSMAQENSSPVNSSQPSTPSPDSLLPLSASTNLSTLQEYGLSDASSLICHYAPQIHGLEVRARIANSNWSELMSQLPQTAFLVGLSSIHWREAWKYGERAFRYCQHDIGHALAALRYAAATLGWQLMLLEELADSEIAKLLGLDRVEDFIDAEVEHPDLLALVWPNNSIACTNNEAEMISPTLSAQAIAALTTQDWTGRANRLSQQQVDWSIISSVAQATDKPRISLSTEIQPSTKDQVTTKNLEVIRPRFESKQEKSNSTGMKAGQIIYQRRSAVAFDGRTTITIADFYHLLARTMPGGMPWDCVGWPAQVHLCLFVHRVVGLTPGLYILVRDKEKVTQLQKDMVGDFLEQGFLWQRPIDCPTELPLYRLATGECQALAKQVCCTQDIAGDGVFSLGMVAEFKPAIDQQGAWYYRRLFWQTGIIGQILYLEAEALGIRATGIGCFFDDPVHEIFGFKDRQYQSLYHFTMGGPVEDTRLMTRPPYGDELKKSR